MPGMPRVSRSPEARKKIAPRRSPVRVILAVLCAALILAYVASAVWNFLRPSSAADILTAITLPAPLAAQPLPAWVPLVSVLVFLALVLLFLLTVLALRAPRSPLSVAPANIPADIPANVPADVPGDDLASQPDASAPASIDNAPLSAPAGRPTEPTPPDQRIAPPATDSTNRDPDRPAPSRTPSPARR